MTIGTAIVIIVAMLCITFLAVCLIGLRITKLKQQKEVPNVFQDALAAAVKERLKNQRK